MSVTRKAQEGRSVWANCNGVTAFAKGIDVYGEVFRERKREPSPCVYRGERYTVTLLHAPRCQGWRRVLAVTADGPFVTLALPQISKGGADAHS